MEIMDEWTDLADEYPTIDHGKIELCTNTKVRYFGFVRKSSLKQSPHWKPRLFVIGAKDGEIQDIDTYVTHWKELSPPPINEPKLKDYSLKQ